MAYHGDRVTHSFKFASAMGAYLPVFMPLASSRDEVVVSAGTYGIDAVGITLATVGTYNEAAPVVVGGVAKVQAAASLGAGVRVAIGSTNGRMIPLTPSGLSTALGSAIGAAGLRFSIGRSLHAAADGNFFSVLLNPEQII